MRLRLTPNSPFARKVRVVALELGIAERIELLPADLQVEDPVFLRQNPLGKVPVLVTDEGDAVADSRVICEYLDASFGGHRLLPAQGRERWHAQTMAALADGVVEAALVVRRESQRPEAQRSAALMAAQQGKIDRGLDRLQEEFADEASWGRFDMAAIATACALGWLELRFSADMVFGTRPALRRWWQQAAEPRASMQATRPA